SVTRENKACSHHRAFRSIAFIADLIHKDPNSFFVWAQQQQIEIIEPCRPAARDRYQPYARRLRWRRRRNERDAPPVRSAHLFAGIHAQQLSAVICPASQQLCAGFISRPSPGGKLQSLGPRRYWIIHRTNGKPIAFS